MTFTCPRCGRTSHNPNDEREGYCGACHDWTGTPSVEGDDYLAKMTRLHVLTAEDERKVADLLAPPTEGDDRCPICNKHGHRSIDCPSVAGRGPAPPAEGDD